MRTALLPTLRAPYRKNLRKLKKSSEGKTLNKVDVKKGELEFKKKCEILQADLDYEKANSTRITQEIRRYQASAMDTTAIQPKTQGSRSFISLVQHLGNHCRVFSLVFWEWGIKEMRLHNAEMRAKTLEKENVKLEEHEEFYINKAREWNSRALKYERTMEQHGVVVSGKENRRDTVVKAANSEPDKPPSLSLPSPFLYLTQKQSRVMRTWDYLREKEQIPFKTYRI